MALALAASGVAACHRAGPSDASILMARDRSWAESTATRGLAGFTAYLAPDASTLLPDQPRATDRDALIEVWKPLMEGGTRSIHWEPFSATLSDSGDMGFTLGTYQILSRGDGGSTGALASSGKYVALWRHEPSGAWDVVFDSGVPDTAAK